MTYEDQIWHDLPAEVTPVSAERLNHMEKGIKDAHNLLSGSLANSSPAYHAAATAARNGTAQLRVAVLGDSTCDGYAGGQAGAPTSWSQNWPHRLAEKLRVSLGLPEGGRGWVPASTPLLPANYSYNTAAQLPAGRPLDQLNWQIGIPGSLWVEYQHAVNAHTIEWTLPAGTTSVDLMLAGYGASLTVTTSNGTQTINPSGNLARVRVNNPGTMVRIQNATGGGIGVHGIVEYRGDEASGTVMFNFAQASMSANDYAGWFSDPDMYLAGLIDSADPHVVLVCLGANDYGTGRTTAQMAASMDTIRAAVRAVVPNAVLGWVVRDLPDNATGGTWDAFADAIVAHAKTRGDVPFDLRTTVPTSAPGALLPDNVHYNAAGMQLVASALATDMALNTLSTEILADMTPLGRQLARATSAAQVRQLAGVTVTMVQMTQAQYNALPTPRDPNILYLIKG